MKNPTKYEAHVITHLHPLFKSLIWAAQARSTDETRFALQHIHVEREEIMTKMVATDGKRMHVASYDPGLLDGDIEPIEPGDYEVVTKASKLIVLCRAESGAEVRFPNWRGILPVGPGRRRDMLVTRESVAKIGICTGRLLATDYAIAACGFGNGFGKDESVHVAAIEHGEGGVVEIRHDLGTAIVMPMSLDDAESAEDEAGATPEITGVVEQRMAEKIGRNLRKGGVKVEVFVPEDDTYDGPPIIDAEDDSDVTPEVSIQDLILELEKRTPVLSRKTRIKQMLDQYGPDVIRRFAEYKDWVDPEKHLLRTIKEAIAKIDNDEPEPEAEEY